MIIGAGCRTAERDRITDTSDYAGLSARNNYISGKSCS